MFGAADENPTGPYKQVATHWPSYSLFVHWMHAL